MAISLAKRNFSVSVFEGRADLRGMESTGSDRSINLALSNRGIASLAKVGLDKDILARLAIPMKGRMIHDAKGKQSEQLYGVYGEASKRLPL